MSKATIRLRDEVNCRIEGLELSTRKRLNQKFSFILPYAYHTPAYKLGRWDGKVNFFNIGGSTYISLLEDILPILISEGYTPVIVDERQEVKLSFSPITEDYFSDCKWPEGHPAEGEPIVFRDYQVEIINNGISNLQSIQEVATGAGKTLITAGMSKIVEETVKRNITEDELVEWKLSHDREIPIGRTIVIVPNKDLVVQTEEDYLNLGLDVGVYFGDRKDMDKTHTICTWQSLNSMEKRFKDGLSDLDIQDFAAGVTALIVDEVHQAKADVLQKLLSGAFKDIPIRWGLTGTIPKDEVDQLRLRICLGEVINQLAAKDLQNMGVLAGCHVNIMQLQDSAEYSNYQQELSFLTTDGKRLDFMAKHIATVSESGNTLVLVDRLKAGQGLKERLEADGHEVVFISGEMKSTTRKTEYKEVSSADSKIIIATYGVAAVGLNIPRIFNLLLIEPGKSFVRVIQSIGRGLRKAKDKDHVEIYDITSTCKFSKRHLRDRKKFYAEAGYEYSISKINYR